MNGVPETLEVPEGMAPEMEVPAKKKRTTVAELQTVLTDMETFLDEGIIPAIDAHEAMLQELKDAPTKLQPAAAPDINARMDTLESALVQLAREIKTLWEGTPDIPEPPEPEIQFDRRPEPPIRWELQAANLATVASVCLTMNDVLMICRAMKKAPDIPDKDKIHILNIACRTAGMDDTIGLRIRAGISATKEAV